MFASWVADEPDDNALLEPEDADATVNLNATALTNLIVNSGNTSSSSGMSSAIQGIGGVGGSSGRGGGMGTFVSSNGSGIVGYSADDNVYE